jgi:hypothetical protein
MTTLLIEHFDAPTGRRDQRAMGAAGERAGDVLAGRTVWCATAHPGASSRAQRLRGRLDGAGPAVAAATVPVAGDDRMLSVAQRVDELLLGAPRPVGRSTTGSELGPAERGLCAEGARNQDALVSAGVGPGDVFVAHDTLSAIAARAAREQGAHAVWCVAQGRASSAAVHRALDFVHDWTHGIDAYLLIWLQPRGRGDMVERVAALVPSTETLAVKEFSVQFSGEEPRRLAWRMALAEIVRSDHGESVGGTLRPRPAVAAR